MRDHTARSKIHDLIINYYDLGVSQARILAGFQNDLGYSLASHSNCYKGSASGNYIAFGHISHGGYMHTMINVDDLITFSDGLKVLVMGKYEYGDTEHKKAEYLLVKQVNEAETMTIGNAFFLKNNSVGNAEDFDCEYIKDDKLIYALMSVMKQNDSSSLR